MRVSSVCVCVCVCVMVSVVAKIEYGEGGVYEGEWDRDGRRHGKGCLTFSDGSKYKGQFKAGLFHGLGQLDLKGGARYEGEFQLGKFQGHGVYYSAGGMKYQGQFVDGQAKGKGLVTLPDGSHGNPRQEGIFQGERCTERVEVKEDIRRAAQAAAQAHSLTEQLNI